MYANLLNKFFPNKSGKSMFVDHSAGKAEDIKRKVAEKLSAHSGVLKDIEKSCIGLKSEIDRLIELLICSIFPGLYCRYEDKFELRLQTRASIEQIYILLVHCMDHALNIHRTNEKSSERYKPRKQEIIDATSIVHRFLLTLPRIQETLQGDIKAAYDGDPSATSYEEVVLAYPGLLATVIYRLSHELFILKVPLIPRLMSEWAHSKTGIDIHPGAQIGHNFFIDHGTGVVIGETAVIGNNVKLYQGVTLGALSFPKNHRGEILRGSKRHPTVESDVTIYANATVLGGETVVQKNCVVGSSAFVYQSVPSGCTVKIKKPNQETRKTQAQLE